MKKILITQRIFENSDYYEIRDCLDVNWALFFKNLNYLPILLPSYTDFLDFFTEIKINGILFTGGNDLGKLSNIKINSFRDQFEKKLIKYGIEQNIPMIGVCRGMQILGEYFGLTIEKTDNHIGEHDLIAMNESKYFDILTKQNKVNSFHQYGIKNVDTEFIISAQSQNGVIEAMEHKRLKIFTQMWHPEREKFFRKEDINLFKKVYG